MHSLEISEISSYNDWKSIFDNWFKELETILKLSDCKEAPYLHAEYGNMHHFSVSASKAGFGTIREVFGTRNGNKARLDLCMISENKVDIVEAKWLEFDCCEQFQREKQREKIVDAFKNALIDAKSYDNKHPLFSEGKKEIRKTGILFLSPYFSKTVDIHKIKDLLSDIQNYINYDIFAWSFPKCAWKLKYWNRIYPGTILIAKRI